MQYNNLATRKCRHCKEFITKGKYCTETCFKRAQIEEIRKQNNDNVWESI